MNRRTLISILMMILTTVALLELALRVFDPLGLMALNASARWMHGARIEHPTGYSYPAGAYDANRMGSVIILADGTRMVPDTNPQADCTLALIGDSVTFGVGVTDSETYANQLAGMYPDLHILNTAKTSYDSTNLSRSVAHYQADAYLYLIVYNDATEPEGVYAPLRSAPLALRSHRNWAVMRYLTPREFERDWELYADALDAMREFPVTYVGFEGDAVAEFAAERVPVTVIPYWDAADVVSFVDSHPNASGHQHIADALAPVVETLIDGQC